MLAASNRRRRHRWLRGALLGVGAGILLLIGVWFGGHPSWLPSVFRNAFVSKTEDQRQMQAVLDLISQDYYRPVDTEKLLNDGLVAMVQSLDDPYSHYYPPALYQSFQQQTNSEVTGIGIQIAPQVTHGGYLIEEVVRNSPAARAGLGHGDLILAVDGHALSGVGLAGVTGLIRGRAGTRVTLRVRRGKAQHDVTLVRANVVVPVAASKLLTYRGVKIGYIALSEFTANSAQDVRQQVKRMLANGARGLILDLRDNPGGLLEQAVAVASIFIPDGTVVSTRGRNQPTTVYTAEGGAIPTSIPMAVLVDRGTASSAEIVTAALQDHHRAEVVGTHTYGKGVFQQINPLPGGGALDITVGEFYTPDGRNLGAGGVRRGAGVTPNIYVYDNPNAPGPKALRVAERVVGGEVR